MKVDFGTSFGFGFNSNDKGPKAKISRNVVAIVGEKGIVLVTNNNDISQAYKGNSVVDSALEALINLLKDIPDNTDEIISKPVRVILPRVISGLVTGSFIDWVRTGKTVTSGEELPKERIEAYAEVMKLMSTKYANVELVADKFATKADKEVTGPAWTALKSKISDIVINGADFGTNKVDPLAQKINDIKTQIADAAMDGDFDKVNKLKSALALVTGEEVPEATEITEQKDEISTCAEGMF